MSSRTNGTPEITYVLWDIVPIILSFVIGIIIAVILGISAAYSKWGRIRGNSLIYWLYGGHHIVEVSGEELTIDNNTVGTTPGLKCLRSVLVINAATLATLLTMIFFDTFVIKSYLGCLETIDCYIKNNDFYKHPLNCSYPLNQEQEMICYEFNFDFFQSFADTGGILVAATLGVVLMTKMWICCGERKCIRDRTYPGCALCGWKCLFVVIVLGITGGLLVLIHIATHHRRLTDFRLVGHILQHVAVIISFVITIFTPWYKLVDPGVDEESGMIQDGKIQPVEPQKQEKETSSLLSKSKK